MGALPKRKISKQRKNQRRSHLSLSIPQLTKCIQCGKSIPTHTVCKFCGVYKNIQVLDVK